MHSELHTPVLFREVTEIFEKSGFKNPFFIDATLGLGWHSELILSRMSGGMFCGFDRDAENLTRARSHLDSVAPHIEKHYIHSSFAHMRDEVRSLTEKGSDFILYDLGVSSVHLDEAERGFSFRFDGPLDMRFDQSRGQSATDLVMRLDARELVRIFDWYGEEKKSWFIANEIVKKRKDMTIDTTYKLLDIIKSASYDDKSPLRVFQALRIAVNEEFSHIEESLAQALELLSVWGILAVITFHSLEDRLVKQFFAPYLEDTIDDVTWQIREKARFAKYSKKPIIPTDTEIQENPRSRSAKMRVIKRVS